MIQITVSSNAASIINQSDNDGDGLFDVWETAEMDINGDGNPDLNLPALGANPDHKTIFVEIDYMEHHNPNRLAIAKVINSFENSPISNPDGVDGIDLIVIVDEEIPHEEYFTIEDLFFLKDTHLGTLVDRANSNHDNIHQAKKMTFHYAVFAHTQQGSDDTSSGESPGIPGMEFMVTLGAPKWGVDRLTGHTVGSIDQQAGTFMHELGHNLGLDHGGADDINCKPNYLSVMSWSRQVSSLIGDQKIDYSWVELDNLTEISLDEQKGIDDTFPSGLKTIYGPDPVEITNVGGPIDWNKNGNIENEVSADINYIESEGCNRDRGQILYGFDDWSNLRFLEPSGWSFLIDNNVTDSTNQTYSHSDIGIDDVIEHRLLLWDSIRNVTLPVFHNLHNSTDLEDDQTFYAMRSILSDTKDNVTDLLISNELDDAITLLQELNQTQYIYPLIDKEKIHNLIMVLEKQK
jgi:hypothetical protein